MNQNDDISLLGRLPIVDPKGKVVAYELLFACSEGNTLALPQSVSDSAKIITAALNIEGIENVVRGKRAYVLVDSNFLLREMILSIPADRFIFELQIRSKMGAAFLERMDYLHQMGYQFTLHIEKNHLYDYDIFESVMPYIADFSITMKTINELGRIEALAMLEALDKPVVIKGVDRDEDKQLFDRLLDCYFQGYTVGNADVLKPKLSHVESEKVIEVSNLVATNAHTSEISKALSQAPSILVQLLQYINSGAVSIKTQVDDVERLVTLLGREKLRNWLLLTLYAAGEKGESNPLLEQVVLRMELMEALSTIIDPGITLSQKLQMGFLALLSLLDKLLGDTFLEISKGFNLSSELTEALLSYAGEKGQVLAFAIAIEQFDLLAMQKYIDSYKISPKSIEGFIQTALARSNTLLAHL